MVSDKEDAKRKGKKTKKMIRVAGGQVRMQPLISFSLILSHQASQDLFYNSSNFLSNITVIQVWEDQSLLNWDSNDYRLFAGDLGNDVTDEVSASYFRYFNFISRCCREHLAGIQASRWPRW